MYPHEEAFLVVSPEPGERVAGGCIGAPFDPDDTEGLLLKRVFLVVSTGLEGN